MKESKKLKPLFAANLVHLRTKAGLSQKSLADLSGLTQNFINDLENNKKCASFKTIERLSAALEVELFQFFLDPAYWKLKDVHFLAILDNLKKSINKTFDHYRDNIE